MGVQVNVDKAVSDYYKKGGTTKFENFLKKILTWAGDDDRINKIEHLAYLLATGKVESDYSLERWESDYVCGQAGVKYKEKPCEKALNYYKSDEGNKANYYTLGVDNRGLPYFGRGLIQLTGKANYKKYGDKIGVNLEDDPEKVFLPQNSYNIAVSYLTDKGEDGTKKSTFERVDSGDLTSARKSVNSGLRDLSKVNEEYKKWVDVLKNNSEVVSAGNKRVKRIVGIGVVLATIGITGIVVYLVLKKTGKLPNFLKKVNL